MHLLNYETWLLEKFHKEHILTLTTGIRTNEVKGGGIIYKTGSAGTFASTKRM